MSVRVAAALALLTLCECRPTVLWQSPRPNANGHYWRIWTHGHVEVLPLGWKLGDPNPPDSRWPTDTPANRAKAMR